MSKDETLRELVLKLLEEGDEIRRNGRWTTITEVKGEFIYDENGGETHYKDVSDFTIYGENLVLGLGEEYLD